MNALLNRHRLVFALALATVTLSGGANAQEKAEPDAARTTAPNNDAAAAQDTSNAQGAITAAVTVAVIIDDDLPLYRRVVSGIAAETRYRIVQLSLRGDASSGERVISTAMKEDPAAIIAVGPKSLAAAQKSDRPVFFCMVPRLSQYRFEKTDIAGVRLEVAPQTQLTALAKIAPGKARVGVVYNPDASAAVFDEMSAAGSTGGVEVVPVVAKTPQGVKAALDGAATKIDAIVMIADPVVLNVTALNALLAFAEAQKVPVVALSGRVVERGALFAFSPNYSEIGRQVGVLSERVLRGDVEIERVGSVEAKGVSFTLNQSVAQKLGLSETMATEALRFAADNNIGLRVVQ